MLREERLEAWLDTRPIEVFCLFLSQFAFAFARASARFAGLSMLQILNVWPCDLEKHVSALSNEVVVFRE